MFNFEKYRDKYINVYLTLYYWYASIREYLFSIINNVKIVYHFNNETKEKTNITWQYYSGLGINKFKNGRFHIKIIDKKDVHHIIIDGNIDLIKNFDIDINKKIFHERKNFTIHYHDEKIDINLEILDNYKKHVHKTNNQIDKINDIFNILGIKSTHITFCNFDSDDIEYKKIHIDELSIHDLYE